MRIRGQVVKINNGSVSVIVTRTGACVGDCASCGGCGEQEVEVEADCVYDVTVGSAVELESDSGYVYSGMVLLFILPVILPIAGYLSVYKLSITAGCILAVILFSLSLWAVAAVSKSKKYLKNVRPKVAKILYKK